MVRAIRRRRNRWRRRVLSIPDNVPESLRDSLVTRTGPPGQKISLRLMKLVEPWRDPDMDIEGFRSLVALATTAWNLDVVRDKEIDDLMSDLPEETAAELLTFRPLLEAFMDRKRQMYPEDDRFIVGWDAALEPDGGFFLTAAAAGTVSF